MELFLTLLSGIGWMIVYEECIRLGFRDRIYAMPFWALGLNFSWEAINFAGELIFKWHGPTVGLTLVQTAVNGFWACLDVVILYTYFKYGKKEWPKALPQKWFAPWTILKLICCFALQIVFIIEFGGVLAAEYSAFLQNLLMSVHFHCLFRRTLERPCGYHQCGICERGIRGEPLGRGAGSRQLLCDHCIHL